MKKKFTKSIDIKCFFLCTNINGINNLAQQWQYIVCSVASEVCRMLIKNYLTCNLMTIRKNQKQKQ